MQKAATVERRIIITQQIKPSPLSIRIFPITLNVLEAIERGSPTRVFINQALTLFLREFSSGFLMVH